MILCTSKHNKEIIFSRFANALSKGETCHRSKNSMKIWKNTVGV